MKKYESLVLLLFIWFHLPAQSITPLELEYDFKVAYCVGTQPAVAWLGEEVALVIEGEQVDSRDPSIMSSAVSLFDDIILKYREITGLNELTNFSELEGLPVIEIVLDNCGAGGLAHHGTMGMSTGLFFFDQIYDALLAGKMEVPQVFFYELNRNFWLPSYNDKFDWAMDDEAQNWGWWTVGMNNAQAYIIPKSLGIELNYFGSDINYWENRMVTELISYISEDQYDFDFGWRQSLMPWHNTESINDLMSGLIIHSYNNFGGDEWIKGFYEHIVSEDIIDRTNVFAYQECRDNVYKVWSYSAKQDLIEFFEDDMKWVISQEAKDCVDVFMNPTVTLEGSQKMMEIFPNPATELLHISTTSNRLGRFELTNQLGRVINQYEIQAQNHSIELGSLEQGIYFIRTKDMTYRFVKI